jgi:hypothetical protein
MILRAYIQFEKRRITVKRKPMYFWGGEGGELKDEVERESANVWTGEAVKVVVS